MNYIAVINVPLSVSRKQNIIGAEYNNQDTRLLCGTNNLHPLTTFIFTINIPREYMHAAQCEFLE